MLKVTTLVLDILVIDLMLVGFLVDGPINVLIASNCFSTRGILQNKFSFSQLHKWRIECVITGTLFVWVKRRCCVDQATHITVILDGRLHKKLFKVWPSQCRLLFFSIWLLRLFDCAWWRFTVVWNCIEEEFESFQSVNEKLYKSIANEPVSDKLREQSICSFR